VQALGGSSSPAPAVHGAEGAAGSGSDTRFARTGGGATESAAGVANGMSPRGRAGKRQVKAQEVSALGADDEFWGQEAWGDDDADDSFDEAAVSDDGEVSRALPLIRL
jgi:hypothetical protein